MIKVNLLPVKEKKKRKEFLIGFFVFFIFAIVILCMFWIYIKRVQVRSNLKKEISQIEEESKGYSEKIAEMKELEKKEADLEGFKKTIKGISELQRKIIVGVDQMALALSDGVWFTNFSQSKGTDSNKFIVTGYAFSTASLRTYFDALRRTGGLLKDATLDVKNIGAPVGTNKQVLQFEISAKVAESAQ